MRTGPVPGKKQSRSSPSGALRDLIIVRLKRISVSPNFRKHLFFKTSKLVDDHQIQPTADMNPILEERTTSYPYSGRNGIHRLSNNAI